MILYSPPLIEMPDIPVRDHFGSFGIKRKFSHHCGVDLYCEEGSNVYAIESGTVVEVNWFTGVPVNSPWWNDTRCISIEGDTGVIVYGEVKEVANIKVGYEVSQGQRIGAVVKVLKKDKGKPTSMLHVMLLEHEVREVDIPSWEHDKLMPKGLKDPTNMLVQCKINSRLSY